MSEQQNDTVEVTMDTAQAEVIWKPVPEGFGLADREHFRWADRVMLFPEVLEGEEQRVGEIFVNAKALPVGTIVEPAHVAGRRVVYRKYHGDKVVVNDQHYIIIDPQYVLLWLADEDEVEEVESA